MRKYTSVLLTLLALCGLAVLSAGCGSDEEEGGSGGATVAADTSTAASDAAGVETAKEATTKASAPINEFTAPGPAFDASGAEGKKVAWISLNADTPFTQAIYGGFEEAAKAAGLEYSLFNGKSDPNEWARGIQKAINDKVDLIILQSIPADVVSAPLQAAVDAGIPVVESFNNEPGEGPSENVAAEVGYCLRCVGEIMANYAIADSDGQVQGVVFTSSDVGGAKYQVEGIEATLEEACPETCSAEVEDVPVGQWEQKLPVVTQSAVRDPEVNYLFPLYDNEVSFVSPAVIQAGAQDRTDVVSFNATPGIVDLIAKDDPLAADVGSPTVWTGWAFADQALRVLTDTEPVEDAKLPYRLFTRENAADLDFSAPEDSWYGDADFRAGYRELWGLN